MLAVTASDFPATVVAVRYSGDQNTNRHKFKRKWQHIVTETSFPAPFR